MKGNWINNRIKLILISGIIFIIFSTGSLYGQHLTKGFDFDSIYNKGFESINSDVSLAKQCLKKLEFYQKQFSPVQKAKTNYLRLKIIYSNADEVKALENKMIAPPDSLGHFDALIFSARKYLERSMPDKAIPLLLEVLDSVPARSEKADYCQITLCEAYREKREYKKGINILNDLLTGERSISGINRAFAYNRLAALYNESRIAEISTSDSVIKYSELCIALSENMASKSNLALSQNELSFQMILKKQYDDALILSEKAVRNFIEAGMVYDAMNALINQGLIYQRRKQYKSALKVLDEATRYIPIEENRNLFIRIYFYMSEMYVSMGDYRVAYDLLKICHDFQHDFFTERMNAQIIEKSAKYDLFTKEQKIREEKQKNDFQKKQLSFLIIIIVILCTAFIFSFFYFRLRKKQDMKQKLLEAVIETEVSERKRIARDLHDGIGPVLSAVNLYFQAYIDAKNEDKEVIQIKMQQVISGAIDEVSRISHNISPHVLENYGLITALNDFIAPLANSSRIKVDFTSGFSGRFELNRELTVYRCITELLNNTIKHADATLITLNITGRDKVLFVYYADNGKGFDISLDKPEGMGLHNIKNRVETLGGKLVIESSLQKGIVVNIEVPVHYE